MLTTNLLTIKMHVIIWYGTYMLIQNGLLCDFVANPYLRMKLLLKNQHWLHHQPLRIIFF